MQYEVELRCVVTKIVTCEGCTEVEARENPFDFAVAEHEADQHDWEVKSVKKIAV